jgi:hypothetical protein
LAEFLRSKGCDVVGTHGSKGKADPMLLTELHRVFNACLGDLPQ